MREVRAGEIYRHFKGQLYQVVAVARHSENDEKYVVYQALYGDMQVWVRPYDMFVGEVDRGKYPQAAQKHRFERLDTIVGGNLVQAQGVSRTEDYSEAGILPEEKEQELSGYAPHSGTCVKECTPVQCISTQKMTDSDNVLSRDKGAANTAEVQDEGGIDGRLLRFLDAPTYQDKINYLNIIRPGVDDELLNNIAAAMDIAINEGPVDVRFASLKSCLMTKAKYECARR